MSIDTAKLSMGINERARASRVDQHRPTSSANIGGYKGSLGGIKTVGASVRIATSLTNSQPPLGRSVAVSRVGTVDGTPN